MRMIMRGMGVACGAAFASALVGLSGALPAWAASSAVVIGGIGTPTLSDPVMSQLLGGAFEDEQRVSVDWPAQAGPITGADDMSLGSSIAVGETNLNAAIDDALSRLDRDANGNPVNGEKVTVVGLSAGSLVVTEVLREMASDPDAPDADEINFVVVADSSRQELVDQTRYNEQLDYTYQPAPDTKYDTTVVTGEYDGYADFPDRPWNLLAVANAQAGKIFVHVPTMFSPLSDVPAKNVTVDVNALGGTTTHYLIPAKTLPLVQANPSLKPQEAALKAKIDAAYSRNDPQPVATRSLAAATPVNASDVGTHSVATQLTNLVSRLATPFRVTAEPTVKAANVADTTPNVATSEKKPATAAAPAPQSPNAGAPARTGVAGKSDQALRGERTRGSAQSGVRDRAAHRSAGDDQAGGSGQHHNRAGAGRGADRSHRAAASS